jgi:hypothetical protein
MGIKAVDLQTLNPGGPLVLTPMNKDVVAKWFTCARTDTVATVKAKIPADASPIQIKVFGGVASNAGTTATVTVTVTDNTGTLSTGSVDVKTNGATTALVQMTNFPILEQQPLQGDKTVSVTYAETGTVSSAGGPWTFEIQYVR